MFLIRAAFVGLALVHSTECATQDGIESFFDEGSIVFEQVESSNALSTVLIIADTHEVNVRPGETFGVWGGKNIDSIRKGKGNSQVRYGGKGGALLATITVPPMGIGKVVVQYSGSTVRGVEFFDADGKSLGSANGTALGRAGTTEAKYGGKDQFITSLSVTHGRLVDAISADATEHPRVEMRKQKKAHAKEVAKLQKEFDAFKKKQAKIEAESAKKDEIIEGNQKELRTLRKDIERYKEEIEALREENKQLREDNRRLRKEVAELKQEVAELKIEIRDLRLEVKRLADLIDDMIGG
ncbi:MAG: hypothetical protein GY927_02160 [bacterium]|nr:hypothetical protein [bacterium]